ncbi:MAG: glycogen/starch/alpha-glucan family phosphorylase [Chlamydiae bacterium]|nr:glycogen/starch/alpha-glucan family phosphorylase [Chlamydiota bacterium]
MNSFMKIDLIVQQQSEALIRKVKHYLITMMGVTLEEATDEEFFRAFSFTIREEIMINWTATNHTMVKTNPRTIYYLCMEFMPGRFLENNISNIHAMDLVKLVMKKLNRSLKKMIMIEHDPGLGNGGLGRLASCLLDSLATQQYPAIGYGLRYHYGIFEQEIWGGVQIEKPENWLFHENPWEFRQDDHAVTVSYAGKLVPIQNHRGVEVYDLIEQEEVRALCYDLPIIGYRETPDFNVVSLRLWTTKESPRNFQLQRYNAGLLDQAAENTSLTDVLYPNDNHELGKRVRLKQEFLLVSASVQDILTQYVKNTGSIKHFADKVRIHINDTHPALVIAELIHILLKDHHFAWEKAVEAVQTCCNYTNHTVLRESLEEWNTHRVQYLLPRQYRIIERLNLQFCNEVRSKFSGDEERVRRMSIIENGQVRMSNLAIYGSHRINGVAKLHTEVLKSDIFKDFHEMYPEKIANVTNGVTQRRWLLGCNPKLATFISKRIGKEWIVNFKAISNLAKFASDRKTLEEFIAIKKENKTNFIDFINEYNPIRDKDGKILDFPHALDGDALFDVQIKRFHEYKRQLLNALHALILYLELKDNPYSRKVKRMIFIGGKAAPGYTMVKYVIQFIFFLSRKINADPNVNSMVRLIFLENYNATRAEQIIPAADLSEQISCAGMEASGTGNMKLAINGALTIGTEDGANIEMHEAITDEWWPFRFGQSAKQNREMWKNHSYNPWDIYAKYPYIARALDLLRDRAFADTDEEHEAFLGIYRALLEPSWGAAADYFFVLNDLPSYFETHKKIEELFAQPYKWAECAIQNISRMGLFSTDESIRNYADKIWGIKPCPVDPSELERVREQYSEHDKCRILY